MTNVPVITIFVRHDPDCPYADDAFYKRCRCWKHLRFFHDGKQKKVSTKQRTWEGAERFRREFESTFGSQPQPQDDVPKTLRDLADLYVQRKRGSKISADVIKRHTTGLYRFVDFLEQRNKISFTQVSAKDLLDYRETWDAVTPAGSSQQKVRGRIKSFFRFISRLTNEPNLLAGDGEECLYGPIKCDSSPTQPFTPEEYKTILDAIPTAFPIREQNDGEKGHQRKCQRVHAYVQCMRHAGLALQDAALLEKSMIVKHPKQELWRIITKRKKTGENVYVPIPTHVAKELLAVPNENPKYVFWNPQGGDIRTTVKKWERTLKHLFEQAGIPEAHSHQLRDTFAVELLVASVPMEDVSRLLGHSSIKTTEKHYAPWVTRRQDRLDEVMQNAWQHMSA